MSEHRSAAGAVAFTDIVGFTEFCALRGDDEAVALLSLQERLVRGALPSGARIVTVHGGKGPPVLLMHGNPFNHLSWYKIAPRLAQEFTVVATDLRGCGSPRSVEEEEPMRVVMALA